MGFSESINTCLKQKYATFQGRASRSEYWWFQLFIFGVYIVLGGLTYATSAGALTRGEDLPVFSMIMIGILGIFVLAMILPMIAAVVRRLHDRNLSGWWYLGAIVAGFIPFVGFIASIALLVITILKGTEGPNKFGRDPLGPEHSADVFN